MAHLGPVPGRYREVPEFPTNVEQLRGQHPHAVRCSARLGMTANFVGWGLQTCPPRSAAHPAMRQVHACADDCGTCL